MGSGSYSDKNTKNPVGAVCGLWPTGCPHECSYESELSTFTHKLIPVAYRNTASTIGKNTVSLRFTEKKERGKEAQTSTIAVLESFSLQIIQIEQIVRVPRF